MIPFLLETTDPTAEARAGAGPGGAQHLNSSPVTCPFATFRLLNLAPDRHTPFLFSYQIFLFVLIEFSDLL
uniref:Uncharacterized protein n=1 Tax=Anguilla anguilla TaxID=7936 RepID=A0A0E9RYY6_ANGAN